MNNNKKIFTVLAIFVNGLTSFAQDTYDAARFASSDLNGTARFVGMGGALSALGGDISVMGTNPAGTALFRKNEASFTFGAIMTSDGALGHDATRMSIYQRIPGILQPLPVCLPGKSHRTSVKE